MKQKTVPGLYRLTLSPIAYVAMVTYKPFKHKAAFERADGKWDVAIPMSLLDQLQTAALPKENLSDTVLRITAPKSNSNAS